MMERRTVHAGEQVEGKQDQEHWSSAVDSLTSLFKRIVESERGLCTGADVQVICGRR